VSYFYGAKNFAEMAQGFPEAFMQIVPGDNQT